MKFEDGIEVCAKLEEEIVDWCIILGDYLSMRPTDLELVGIEPLIGEVTEMQNEPKNQHS